MKSGGVIEVDNLKGRPNKDGVVTTFKGKLQINAQKGRVALVYSSQQRLNNRLDRIAARKAEKESNIYSMPVDQFLQMIEKQAVPAETVPQQDNAGINQAPPSQIRPESNVVPIGEEQINPAPVQTAAPAKADVPEQTTAPKQTNTPVQTEQTPGKSPEKTVQPPKVVPVTVAAKKGGKNRGPSLT